MAAESSLTVRAELSQLRKDLQSAGSLSEGQAQAMVISLEKRLKAAESAAKKTAKAQQDAAKAAGDWSKKLDGVQQVAAQLPGPLAQIASMSIGASKGLGTLGVAAGAVAGATAAVGALAIGAAKGAEAVISLAQSAVEARDRLAELHAEDLIDPTAAQRLDEVESDLRAMGAATDLLRVNFVGSIPIVGDFLETVTGVVVIADKLTTSVGNITGALDGMTLGFEAAQTAALTLATGGGYLAILRLNQLLGTAQEQGQQFADTIEGLQETIESGTSSPVRHVEHLAAAVRDTGAAAKEAAEATGYSNEAVREAVDLFDELAADQIRAKIAANDAAVAQQKWTQELTAFHAEADRAKAAMAGVDEIIEKAFDDAKKERIKQQAMAVAGFVDVVGDATGSVADLLGTINEQQSADLKKRMDGRREEIDNWLAGEQERIAAAESSGEITEAQAEKERITAQQTADDRNKALQQRTRDERRALLDNFKDQKKWAIGAIIIDAAAAGIKAVAQLGPIAGGIAAIAIGIDAGNAISKVNKQAPPEFPMGRLPVASPDHTETVRIRNDEAILNARAVAAMGGPDAVRDANNGNAAGNITVQIVLDRAVLAEAIAERVDAAIARAVPKPGSVFAGKRLLTGGV